MLGADCVSTSGSSREGSKELRGSKSAPSMGIFSKGCGVGENTAGQCDDSRGRREGNNVSKNTCLWISVRRQTLSHLTSVSFSRVDRAAEEYDVMGRFLSSFYATYTRSDGESRTRVVFLPMCNVGFVAEGKLFQNSLRRSHAVFHSVFGGEPMLLL